MVELMVDLMADKSVVSLVREWVASLVDEMGNQWVEEKVVSKVE
jgi:hypothetical protein